ncbi:ribose-5-phosphate isomerase RpiA [Marinicella gelatinilytica]|uniref:ribose-5-phosphate isomerase RpiA n=1 Tax=Marinicella gelatinilytica TaxID=2996017 RepID=UPI002260E2B0|nr:ribose-5-phosphate isomerase RpiA [Marinicella gelatinilytica]MCX7545973.1 ribose-5-phosphate isomerase RpiA [Marinicella gelatinilytica]
MSNDDMKKAVARAALEYLDEYDMLIGMGTGSTVNHFIDLLSTVKSRVDAVVSSSEATTAKLKAHGFHVKDLNQTGDILLYFDGADECDAHNRLIKGGGGALTREKVLAEAAEKFICLIDETKRVDILGGFPLPVEVIPMARSLVARKLVALGGQPVFRQGFVTDNGNEIIDVKNLTITDPISLEQQINAISGVVSNGLFARRGADITLIADSQGQVTTQK